MAKAYTTSKTIEYTGTLPMTINANGSALADYRVYGANGGVGDRTVNLFEVESDMLLSSNWDENPPYGVVARVYFINYKLSDAVTQELKKGIHTCSVFEHFTDGYTPDLLVCAFTPTVAATVDASHRILSNQGETFVKTFDFSNWQDIYLIIGYGNGFDTEATKQSKIDELFTNWEISIVEGSTAPAEYVPYGYGLSLSVTSPKSYTCEVNSLQASTNYAKIAVAELPTVKVGDKVTVTVGGTDYTLPVKNVDSSYVYIENMEV